MYHDIQETHSGLGKYYETSTSPAVFAQHMRYLSENGYFTTTLEGVVNGFGNPPGAHRPVVVTFDDGLRTFYTTAAPIMQRFGFTATVFLIAGLTGDHRHRFHGLDCMTWGEAREMQACGMSIGSHTVTHPKLASMERNAIDEELSRSKQIIEDGLGTPVTSFSYPFAFPEADRGLVAYLGEALQRYGYQNGVSTIIGTAGPADSPYFLPRIPTNTWDDGRLFQAKLEGAYDWLHVPQSIYKSVRRRVTSVLR
jgi:peptidoglycan/xylan/chitin deacetylase (PgdA/CDA1 family)